MTDDFLAPTLEADSRDTPSEIVDGAAAEGSIESQRLRGSLRAKLFGEDASMLKIGRFKLVRRLGAGGMGVVYLGQDEDLAREVAIKLLHKELSGEGGAARNRLIREAQAMAQLSHPNVIPVFEVGTHEGAVFIAMEYVPGPTLRDWLAKQPRDWTEIVEKFVQAGRGLAAAHARGLIHRDFKPDNVIVGDDGRVRVVDFGLARPPERHDGEGDHASGISGDANMLDVALTRAGAIVGTPAYMAPEQHQSRPSDARTDEFGFCVALFESLYGRRPFDGETYNQLRDNVVEGKLRPAPTPNGPAELLRVVERGLKPAPDDRWPSMDALLDQLERASSGPQRRRRNSIIGAAAAVTLSVGAFAAMSAQATGDGSAPASACVPAHERFAGVWDDAKKTELETRYASAPKRAQQWWTFESGLLDTWSQQWTRIYERSCAEEAETDLARFALRQTCLDRRMIEIKTRVALLETLEPEDRAAAGAGDYVPFYLPADCENEALVSSVALYPADPKERAQVVDAMVGLRVAEGVAQAAFFGGDPKAIQESMAVAHNARQAVEDAGFRPDIAELRVRQGNGLLVAGVRHEEAFAFLDDGIKIARETRSVLIRVLAEAWKLKHEAYMDRLERTPAQVLGSLDEWEQDLISVGAPAYGMIKVLHLRAQYQTGPDADAQTVLASCGRANEIAIEAFGEGSWFTAQLLSACADVMVEAGLHEQARRAREQATAATDQAFGPDSINLNFMLRSASEHALMTGDLDGARKAAERRVAVMKQHHAPADAILVAARLDLARVAMAQGDYDTTQGILDALAPYSAGLTGVYADDWTLTRLIYMALAGEPGTAAAPGVELAEAFDVSKELQDALRPVLAGLDPADAERELSSTVDQLQHSLARAPALIQLGRLREQLGRKQQAAEAYQAAAAIDTSPEHLVHDNYAPALRYAAEQGLARTQGAG